MTRRYKRKRIRLITTDAGGNPVDDPDNYVDIPVISGLQFLGTRGQIFNYKVVNDSSNKSRRVRIKRVRAASFDQSAGEITYNEHSYVDAERILVGNFLGTNGQIFKHKFNNRDPSPKTPEAAAGLQDDQIGHYKVHYVRYYKDNDDGSDDNGSQKPWVTVEIIDRLQIIGTNGQIFNYKIRWPNATEMADFGTTPRGTTFGTRLHDADPYRPLLGYCNPDLELMPEEFDDDNNPLPLRTDVLQNLVNIKGPKPPEVSDHMWPFLWNGARNRGIVASVDNPFWFPCNWSDIVALYPAYIAHGFPPADDSAFDPSTLVSWAINPGLFMTAGYNHDFHWVSPDAGDLESSFNAYFVHLSDTIQAGLDNHGGIQSDVPGNSPQWSESFGVYSDRAFGSYPSWLGPTNGGHQGATPDRSTIWAYGLYQTDDHTGGYAPPPLPPNAGKPPP